ncbi:MucBP domain-containing protein [Dellaglioa algida]|uniref:MucBP domain-containing protein n=1 Tax=Dellaglioa algida TaxID=105612 RepID=UPI0024C4A2BA|nr:MucBP domain-containing protein [Dellaglioa algida]MDK1728856.1 MucBP domain-containing protein [Dellaglioa algida]MDK1736535.1 MucBP domain-containing protein [Dellaglioa algida]MDK1738194.1 MucBP domain-containing protein [Dellaglioa algida]
MLNKKCFKMYKSKKTWIFTSTALAVMGVVAGLNPTTKVSGQELPTVSSALVQKNLGVGSPKLNEHAVKNNNENLLEINDHPLSKVADKSGVFGTAPWDFTAGDGVLTIHAGTLLSGGNLGQDTVGGTSGQNVIIKKVIIEPGVVPGRSMSGLFRHLNVLGSIEGLENLNTSNVTDMRHMFGNTAGLTELDVSHFNTSNVTDMSGMFLNCYSPTIDVSHFNTLNVTNMSEMFFGTSKVKILDVSKWDVAKVTDMNNTFNSITSVTELDVSQWNTSNVTNMSGMFLWASSYSTLDVSQWNTSNVTNMHGMFAFSNITELDLSQWSLKSIERSSDSRDVGTEQMFADNTVLWKVKLSPDFINPDDLMLSDSPSEKVKINDMNDVSKEYHSSGSSMWREVGSGTDHNPMGKHITAAEISKERTTPREAQTYVWDQNQDMRVNTVNATNSTVLNTVTLQENDGQKITLDPKDYKIPAGYHLATQTELDALGTKLVQSSLEQEFKAGGSDVNLYVVQDAKITYKFQDGYGKEIKSEETEASFVGDKYDYKAPTITGYTYEKADAGLAGTVDKTDKVITLTYKQDAKLTYKFQDRTGKEIKSEETEASFVGDKYDYKAPIITGYTYEKADASLSGTVDKADKVITLTYKQDAKITYKFQDSYGKEIKSEETESSFVGDKYDYKAPTITGYTYEKADTSLSGTVDKADKVITLTYKQDAKITYKFQDKTGKEIKPEETEASFVGDKYDYKAPTITGYTYEKADAGLAGTVDKADKVITLTYKQDAKLTYKFQDRTGKEIKPEETEASFVGDKYDYKAPKITGYTYEKADAGLAGTVDKADKVITLTYKQDAKLTYKFQDSYGKEIKSEETESSFVGDKYDYKAPTIAGYTYEKADASLSGTVDRADKVITLTYKINDSVLPTPEKAQVTFKFVDEYGKTIASDNVLDGFVGNAFNFTAPKISGYKYKSADAALDGDLTAGNKVITLTYTTDDSELPTPEKTKVTFKFVDEYGKTIASDNVLDGFVGNAFNFTAPKISGYKYKSADAALKGDLVAGNKVITLTYTTDDSELPTPEKAKVTFKFVDEYGKTIASDNVLDGFVGNTFNFTAPKISGYKYKSADAELKGDLVAGNKIITLTYTTDDSELPTPEKAKVTFKFVDEYGKTIASDNVLDGFVGNAFNFTAPKISGYKYKNADAALEGDLTTGNKVITLTYTTDDSVLPTPEKAKVTFKFVDENGKAIASDNVLDGFVGNAFNFTAPKISGYKYKSADAELKGDLTAGNKVITLTYTADDSVPPIPEKAKVTFKFVDENGKAIASDNVLDGFVGGTFNFTAPKISGYKYKNADAALKGDLTAGNKVITLTYTTEDSNVQNPIVNAHDSELSVGDSWKAQDNFDGAFDKDGQKVDFKDVTVSGTVDTTKAGSYKITYSYNGVSKTIVVTVVAKPEKEKPTEEKPVEEKPEKEETVPPLNKPSVPGNKTGTGQVANKAEAVKNVSPQSSQSGETLPQTGEKVNQQSVWAGLGLILLSSGLIFVSKRRRSK